MCRPRDLSLMDLRYRLLQETPGPGLCPLLAEVVARSRYTGASRIECHIAHQADQVASLNMHRIYRPLWPSKVASHFRGQRIRLDCVLTRYIVRDWRLYHKCDSLCTDACATVCTNTTRLCHLCKSAPVGPSTSRETKSSIGSSLPSEMPEGRELLRQVAEYLGDSSFMEG